MLGLMGPISQWNNFSSTFSTVEDPHQFGHPRTDENVLISGVVMYTHRVFGTVRCVSFIKVP